MATLLLAFVIFVINLILITGSQISRNPRQAQVIFETYDPLLAFTTTTSTTSNTRTTRTPTLLTSASLNQQLQNTTNPPTIQFVFEQVDYTFPPSSNQPRTFATTLPTTTTTTAATTRPTTRRTPSTAISTTTTIVPLTSVITSTDQTEAELLTESTTGESTTSSTISSTRTQKTTVSLTTTTKVRPTTSVDILIATDSPLVYSVRQPQMQYNTENFCDSRLYSDSRLKELQLLRLDYFVANISCSSAFYKCGDGETFLLRCSGAQVFDPTSAYCNYKNNVGACAEYDPVLHCRIGGTCKADQFACCASPQSCIDYIKRCDGVADCADGEDEVNCQSCPAGEFACHKAERCIPMQLRCNGVNDCGDETALDERGCDVCPGNRMFCSRSSVSPKFSCLEPTTRCNSVRDCPNGEDELNCKARGSKVLLCENQKLSVSKEKWCDGFEDCPDGSDEKYCF